MDEDTARKILGPHVNEDNSLSGDTEYIHWSGADVSIDGGCSVEFIEALAWWMRHKEIGK